MNRFAPLARVCAATLVLFAAPALAGDAVQVTQIPLSPGAGPAKETKTALDHPSVKLSVIHLRNGTLLPMHAAKNPVTIQALSGKGKLRTQDGTEYPLAPGTILTLAANVEHEVLPAGKATMVILVTHLLGSPGSAPAAAGDEHHEHHDDAKPKAQPEHEKPAGADAHAH